MDFRAACCVGLPGRWNLYATWGKKTKKLLGIIIIIFLIIIIVIVSVISDRPDPLPMSRSPSDQLSNNSVFSSPRSTFHVRIMISIFNIMMKMMLQMFFNIFPPPARRQSWEKWGRWLTCTPSSTRYYLLKRRDSSKLCPTSFPDKKEQWSYISQKGSL